ncbi:MAG: hypothetical protein WC208_13510 [Gallionella sp.]|jgi:hypothetical protein
MPTKKKVTDKSIKKAAKPVIPSHPLMINEKDWNRALVMDHVCNEIATSSRGIGKILSNGCNGNTLPKYSTFMCWLEEEKALSDRYAKAKDAQADFMADEMLEIADSNAEYVVDSQGVSRKDSADVQHKRLRVDTRKWLASKLKPKKYGDKTTIAGDAENPLAVLTMDQITANPKSRIKA